MQVKKSLRRKVQSLHSRRKAISPVIATILLIALTVTAVAIVYFVIVPMFNKRKLSAEIYSVKDTNKDSQYDQIVLQVANSGTASLNITTVVVWTCPKGLISQEEYWSEHTGWTFQNSGDSLVSPSEIKEVTITGEDQITLTIVEETYYRLEIAYSGQKQPYYSDWKLLNDQVDFSGLVDSFQQFSLLIEAFNESLSVDVEGYDGNNYQTDGSGEYTLPINDTIYLPVKGEIELIPFYVTDRVAIFNGGWGHPESTIKDNPTNQTIDLSDNPLKARKIYLLGLAGSWGWDFDDDDWALKIEITYTDGTKNSTELGKKYIDDWWNNSNNDHGGMVKDNYPNGPITFIDLGEQLYGQTAVIHTHTAAFVLDHYKYIQAISFIDRAYDGTNDGAGSHLLSLVLG